MAKFIEVEQREAEGTVNGVNYYFQKIFINVDRIEKIMPFGDYTRIDFPDSCIIVNDTPEHIIWQINGTKI